MNHIFCWSQHHSSQWNCTIYMGREFGPLSEAGICTERTKELSLLYSQYEQSMDNISASPFSEVILKKKKERGAPRRRMN